MPKLRVHNFSISVDGFAAGPGQDIENPLGVGGMRFARMDLATPTFGAEGVDGVDEEFAARMNAGIGATIMGRNMFCPIRGDWTDEEWKGWVGRRPEGLIDQMHVAIAPVILGSGERLFDNPNGGLSGYTCEFTASASVVHAVVTRS